MYDNFVIYVDAESIAMLKKRYECPYFRILVIGRANAGKTTILEKVCGVAQGTKPIIYDEHGVKLKANIKPDPVPKAEPKLGLKLLTPKRLLNRKQTASVTHLTPSMEVSCIEHMDLH